jgi:AhpD family alkylhydroperoxidase
VEEFKKILSESKDELAKLSKSNPKEMSSFMEFIHQAEKGGAINEKTKELIAIACAVVLKCDPCIAFHVQSAIKAKATKEEILDAGMVAVVMGGGPALMYLCHLNKAIDEFIK